MVLGQPTTRVELPCAAKYSASSAAFVLLSSPPMMMTPSRRSAAAAAMDASNCSGVSILSRPEPMMSNPPRWRYRPINSASMVTHLLVKRPRGPSRKPISALSACGCSVWMKSKRPAMTLWPPAAWPPDSTQPIRSGVGVPAAAAGLESAVDAAAATMRAVGRPNVRGNSAASLAATPPSATATPPAPAAGASSCTTVDVAAAASTAGSAG